MNGNRTPTFDLVPAVFPVCFDLPGLVSRFYQVCHQPGEMSYVRYLSAEFDSPSFQFAPASQPLVDMTKLGRKTPGRTPDQCW